MINGKKHALTIMLMISAESTLQSVSGWLLRKGRVRLGGLSFASFSAPTDLRRWWLGALGKQIGRHGWAVTDSGGCISPRIAYM